MPQCDFYEVKNRLSLFPALFEPRILDQAIAAEVDIQAGRANHHLDAGHAKLDRKHLKRLSP